jgi:transposase
MKQRKHYPSDVSRNQFDVIRPILESARKRTKPRRLDLYELFCGVLYVLRGGIQWRMLPSDFPKWRSVYAYWQKWSKEQANGLSVLDESLKKIGWRHAKAPWARNQNQPAHH